MMYILMRYSEIVSYCVAFYIISGWSTVRGILQGPVSVWSLA